MKTKKFAAIVLLTLFCFAGYLTFAADNETPPHLSYRWHEGEQYLYELDYTSNGKGKFAPASAQNTTSSNRELSEAIKIEIVGHLAIIVDKVTPDKIETRISLSASKFVFNYNGSEVLQLEKDENILAQVNYNGRGNVINFKMTGHQYENYSDIIRDILALSELPFPLQGKHQWKGSEKNLNANLPVLYTLTDRQWSFSDFEITKEYKNTLTDHNLKGLITFVFDHNKHLVRTVSGFREREFYLNSELMSKDKTNLTLTLFDNSTNSSIFENTKENFTVTDDLLGHFKKEQMKKQTKKQVLGEDTVKSLIEKLASIDSSNLNEITQLSRKFVALLELHPEKLAEVVELLNIYNSDDERFKAILGALGYLGTPEIQHEFVQILTDIEEGSDKYKKIMTSLAFVKHPSLESENFFREQTQSATSQEIKDKSVFALGMIARRVESNEPLRSENLVKTLTDDLEKAQSDREVRLYIKAMGNAGNENLMPSLEKYINDDNPKIKLDAIFSLRFIDNNEAKAHLITALKDDNKVTREIAASALSFTPGTATTLEAYKTQLDKESNIQTLKFMLKNVAAMGDTHPESIQVIDTFIQDCGRPEICNFAKDLKQSFKPRK